MFVAAIVLLLSGVPQRSMLASTAWLIFSLPGAAKISHLAATAVQVALLILAQASKRRVQASVHHLLAARRGCCRVVLKGFDYEERFRYLAWRAFSTSGAGFSCARPQCFRCVSLRDGCSASRRFAGRDGRSASSPIRM